MPNLRKYLEDFTLLIPFVQPYPYYVKVMICGWVVFTAILFCCLLFTRNSENVSDVKTPEKPATKTFQEAPILDKVKTLHEYYRSDFSRMMGAGGKLKITVKDKGSLEVEANIYMDFDIKAKVVSFYLPSSPITYAIVEYIGQYAYQEPIKFADQLVVESRMPGDRRGVDSRELSFNGVVYIYHESPLLDLEIDRLLPIFKGNKLNIQFRGPEYEFARNNPPPMPPRIPKKI